MAAGLALGDHGAGLECEIDTELDGDLVGAGLAQLVEGGACGLGDRLQRRLQCPRQLTHGITCTASLYRPVPHGRLLDQKKTSTLQRNPSQRCHNASSASHVRLPDATSIRKIRHTPHPEAVHMGMIRVLLVRGLERAAGAGRGVAAPPLVLRRQPRRKANGAQRPVRLRDGLPQARNDTVVLAVGKGVEGELLHDVDHVTRTVARGQWLWVRPGHAQCCHPPGAARGLFILFEPDVLTSDAARLLAPLTAHEAPAVLSPHSDDAAWLRQTGLQLLDEHRALGRRRLDVHHALRRSLLESLLLRLANSPDVTSTGALAGGTGRRDTYARFVDALELHFRELHRAADYAGLLGCSVRTLSRAARDTTGKGVREVIDERRLLEARRLLRGGGWDARAVAVHLGFTDPANFGRFFRGHTGLTPAAFTARETRTGM